MAAPGIALPTAVLWSLWSVWLLSWLVAARWSSATVFRQPRADWLGHSILVWGGAILVFAKPAPLPHPFFPAALWLAWAGVALTVLGLALTWWSRIHLGKNWSAAVTLKEGHMLVRSGPYAIARHPIYTGLLVAFAGTVLAYDTASALLGFVLVILGFVLKLRQEERLLVQHFGAAYHDYRKKVRALVPGIW